MSYESKPRGVEGMVNARKVSLWGKRWSSGTRFASTSDEVTSAFAASLLVVICERAARTSTCAGLYRNPITAIVSMMMRFCIVMGFPRSRGGADDDCVYIGA